jgi:hypothetical protein
LERMLIRLTAARQQRHGERRTAFATRQRRQVAPDGVRQVSATAAVPVPGSRTRPGDEAAVEASGAGSFPASWPPSTSGESGTSQSDGSGFALSPRFKSASQSLKSKLSSLRLRCVLQR